MMEEAIGVDTTISRKKRIEPMPRIELGTSSLPKKGNKN